MELIDDRILETLNKEQWSTPYLLATDIEDGSVGRIRERCEVLRSAGLVERELDNHYEISQWGALYLDGEVSAKSMRPLPSPRPPEGVRPRKWSGCV